MTSGGYRILLRGGTKRARSARKIFCPPPELLRGGTGGGQNSLRGGTKRARSARKFVCPPPERILSPPCPPPEELRGGQKDLVPPPELLRGVQNSRGRGKSSGILKYRYLDVLNSIQQTIYHFQLHLSKYYGVSLCLWAIFWLMFFIHIKIFHIQKTLILIQNRSFS